MKAYLIIRKNANLFINLFSMVRFLLGEWMNGYGGRRVECVREARVPVCMLHLFILRGVCSIQYSPPVQL